MRLLDYIKLKEKEAINNNLEDSAIKYLISNKYYESNQDFYNDYFEEINQEKINEFDNYLNKYLVDKLPPQYILGYTYFYGYKILVNSDVLIPRKETEEVVETALALIENNYKILDLCTGSGAIAIALKKELDKKKMTNCYITASDISKKALEVSQKNFIINNVNIDLIESDLFDNINDTFDMIISNPPYIPVNSKDVEDIVLNNEPSLALFSEDNGLYHYKKIIKEASKYLKNKKYLVFEIGHDQLERLTIYTKSIYPNAIIKGYKDLEGKDRILVIKLGE